MINKEPPLSQLPYRLCAIDLDETLLGPTQQISERNVAAVRAVAALGVSVVLASGRMHESVANYAEQLGLETPIVSYNGAMVRLAHSNEMWRHLEIPGEQAKFVMDYCREENMQLNYYRDNCVYSAAETHWITIYQQRTKAPLKILPDFYTALYGLPTTKLLIVNEPTIIDAIQPYFVQHYSDNLYITTTSDEYLEFMLPEANKGAGLALVAERLGVPLSETLAFGDGHNDIPLLQTAGLGVAVGNAKPELKAVAGRIAKPNTEDGVAQMLAELFGIAV